MKNKRKISIFMDCGAPSIYNKLSRQLAGGGSTVMGAHIRNRKNDDFSYVETDEFEAYRQDYLDFVLEHDHILDVYPNLDIINNAELTYQNQLWLEERGARPIPVWHLGSHKAWLCEYLDRGYDYMAIGGMVPNSKSVLRPALDDLWRNLLTDKEGMPIIKVHGFAMTSFDLMYRYPWYSVDSKSWIDIAKYGGILVPDFGKGGKRDYLHPRKVHMTPRSVGSHAPEHHFTTTSRAVRKAVLRYLKEVEVPLGVSDFKKVSQDYELEENEQWVEKEKEVEIVIEKGVINTHYLRLDVNIQLYRKIEQTVPDWPWRLPRSIKQGKKGLLR